MPNRSGPRRRVVAAAVAAALSLGSAAALPADAAAPWDTTSPVEAARVDAVPTPTPDWYRCYGYAQCATLSLPLDYDDPNGPSTEIAVLRVKAKNQRRKIGSLFLNPGGPGGSGTEMAYLAPYFLSRRLLTRFDIVGFDPRGTNFSDPVRCFRGNAEQVDVLPPLIDLPFPVKKAEERRAVRAAQRLGVGCSTTGRPLSASMSTAQVARDMDVLRRAVGDRELTYLGFSYGSYLGQVYANLFPERFRALAIDGVLDPLAWAGRPATAGRPQTDRLRSADGAYKALREILVRCDRAGRPACRFAKGKPVRKYDVVAHRLKRKPLTFPDPFTGERIRFTYADLVASTLGALYGPYGYLDITDNLQYLYVLTNPRRSTRGVEARKAASRSLAASLAADRRQARPRPGWAFPYDNSLEAFASVTCTDGLNPASAQQWPAAAAAADRRAKYFGRLWTWASVPCASRTWTARDEDSYRGPFTRRTKAPVLVVGTRWDPATNYAGAVRAARLLPNSRLLSSNNWGHTAYGSSLCVNRAMVRYLLTSRVPPAGTWCRGDVQPFTDGGSMRRDATRRLPPVVPLVPFPRLVPRS